jgi:hypothetical protein
MKKHFVLLCAFAAPAAFAVGTNEVCLFENSNYGGSSQCYVLDDAGGTVGFLGGFNDKASSIQVGSAVNVDLYEHGGKQGTKWTFGEDFTWLGNANDKASSLEISLKPISGPSVCLYENANYGGASKCWNYTGSKIDVSWLDGFNDKASSIKVSAGLKVTGYRDSSFQNKIGEYIADTGFLAAENDSFSSLTIEAVTPTVVVPPPPPTATDTTLTLGYKSGSGSAYTFYLTATSFSEGATITGSLTSTPQNEPKSQWILTSDGQLKSKFNSNYCIGQSTDSVKLAKIYACNNSENQKWLIQRASPIYEDRVVIVTKADSSKCISGYGTTPVNQIVTCASLTNAGRYFKRATVN